MGKHAAVDFKKSPTLHNASHHKCAYIGVLFIAVSAEPGLVPSATPDQGAWDPTAEIHLDCYVVVPSRDLHAGVC